MKRNLSRRRQLAMEVQVCCSLRKGAKYHLRILGISREQVTRIGRSIQMQVWIKVQVSTQSLTSMQVAKVALEIPRIP
jgi:hypothetical protein